MKKYFGTDGIRGRYGDKLTEEVAFLLGAVLGKRFAGPCVVGRDTRVSGLSLFKALEAGLISSKSYAVDAGVLPTPAVSLLVKEEGFEFGVMITASHNAPIYNGLKVFGPGGIKLGEKDEIEIEAAMYNEEVKKNLDVGIRVTDDNKELLTVACQSLTAAKAREIYINELVNSLNDERLYGMKILLDAGNGAAGTVAKEVFERLGASATSINDDGNGVLINVGCGSESIEGLAKKMEGFDLGFGFDGDADRVAVVVGDRVVDGDSLLYSLSKGADLKDGVVVGTVMANSVLEKRLSADGKRLVRTAVGDKYILDLMMREGYSLGGEQSGHYIFYPERKTGDGILTALKVCVAFKRGELEFLELLPQRTVSLFADRSVLKEPKLRELIEKSNKRVVNLLVRMSGTEPKIRISAEDGDVRMVDEVLGEFEELIEEFRSMHNS